MLQIWQGEAEHIASILKRQHQLASGEMALNAETKRCKSEAKRDRKRVKEREREAEGHRERADRQSTRTRRLQADNDDVGDDPKT